MAKKFGIEKHEHCGFVIEFCDAGPREDYMEEEKWPLEKENVGDRRKRMSYWRIRISGDPSFVPEHASSLAKAKSRAKQLHLQIQSQKA